MLKVAIVTGSTRPGCNNEAVARWVHGLSKQRNLDSTTSGDAAVNDCTIQPLVPDLPFGGVGNSGMGKYHGEWGFRSYANARGVLHHGTRNDPDPRYPPHRRPKALHELVAS